MVVLGTCKNDEDSIKNRGARVFKTLYINFSDALWSWCWYLVEICTHSSFHVCPRYLKNENDRIKNEEARVFTRFPPL